MPNWARAPVKMMPASTQAPAGEHSSAAFHIQTDISAKTGASSGGAPMMPVSTSSIPMRIAGPGSPPGRRRAGVAFLGFLRARDFGI